MSVSIGDPTVGNFLRNCRLGCSDSLPEGSDCERLIVLKAKTRLPDKVIKHDKPVGTDSHSLDHSANFYTRYNHDS